MLYDPKNCTCLNVDCDLYLNCEECINRHHSSRKYPLTACEICKQEGCEKAEPRGFRQEKDK